MSGIIVIHRDLPGIALYLAASDQESGHVPVGQESLACDEESPHEKVENFFFIFTFLHFGQICLTALTDFSKNSSTWPHFSHWYSNIGIFNSLLKINSVITT